MSMATRLSDLVAQKPGINIHTEGHILTPPSRQNWPWRSRGIWKHPITFTIPISGKETNTWLARDLLLFGNTGDLHWIWENNTATTSCMAGANSGRHGSRWQIQPDRSSSYQPRKSCSLLWVAIIRKANELGWGMRCCVHVVRSHWLGWQTSPTQCQTGKPGWLSVVDCPSHHWRTHLTKSASSPSFHPTCFNTIQFP